MNEQGLENPSDYNWEVQDDDATDYVFPLSCYELDHLYSVAEGRIKHGVEFSFSEGVRPIYWTRSNVSKFLSMSDNNSIDGVKAVTCWTGYYDFMMKSYCSWSGTEVSDPPEEPFIGVSPAMNVDISNVALTTKKGVSHTSQMTDNPVGKSSNHHLVMSLPDGNDEYQAIRLDDKIISSEEGGKIQLEVSGETSTSDQITGMIINSNQDIIYFGKIGNVGEGKYEVSIPGGLPVGDYVLKSFSEENISDNATSYVSNMQDVSFQVRNQLKDVTLSETTFIRDDSEKGPVVTVKYNNKVLTEGTDYEISGTKRATKASGKEGYTLTVTGIGDYYGQVEKKWWIKNPPMDGKITADPVQSVYDGENHEIHVDIDSSIENPSIQYSLDGENFDTEMPVCKNVVVNEDGSIGSYKIYYKVSEDDYEDYIGSTTLTIEPKEITLVWGENNLVYNGKKQAPSATAKGLIDGDTCDVIVSGMQKDSNQKTGESVYTAAAESLTNKNYILPKENKEEFYIQPKTVDISWENELVYNGKKQKAIAKATGLEEGDEAEIETETYDTESGEKISAVNVGIYKEKALSISNANYQLPEKNVSEFKIIPKALIDPSVHVTLTGDGISYEEKNNAYIFEWDGKEKTPEVQLTDDQTGEVIVLKRGIDYTISGDQMEDEVGDYTIVLTGKGNYGTGIRSHKRKIVWKIAKAVINPALVMENWTYGEKASDPKIGLEDNNASVTYTYYLDKECTQKTSEADGASVAGGKPSNAGDYYVRAEVAETDCYEAASVTVAFTIQKRSISVTPNSGQYKIYGDTVPVISYQVEGLMDGDNLSGNLSYGKDENAGSYEITKGTLSN